MTKKPNTNTFLPGQVSAVIPVYNEERYLRETLDSVVHQVDCVIISDNASTDGTEAICREYMQRYSHIQYFKNEINIGSIKNIVLLYEKVKTEFVFHLGAHDLIPRGYVEELKNTIKTDQEAICAFADSMNFDHHGNEKRLVFPNGQAFLEDARSPNPYFRAYSFIENHFWWLPIYGLFRAEMFLPIAKNFQPISNCDAAILFESLLHGKILHSPSTVYRRRDNHLNETGNEYYDDAMKRVCGESNEPLPRLHDLHPFVKQVFLAYENYNNPKYLDTKSKYHFLLKLKLCAITGEKTGYLFYDLRIQLKLFWKKFAVYCKTNFLPSCFKKEKYRKKT